MAGAARRLDPRRGVAAVVGAAAVLLVAGCGGASGSDAGSGQTQAPPVALHLDDVPAGLKLGVVVTLTSAPGQGADWSEASAGAQVAAFRYQLGGTAVDLTAVNDKGTAEGATAAVRQLADDHVAGIVFATSGSHLSAGLAQAQSAGIPSVLAYPSDVTLPDDAWSIAPTTQQIDDAMANALSAQGASDPVVIDAGGSVPQGVSDTHLLRFRSGGDAARLAAKVVRLQRKEGVDAIVIAGDATTEATLTAAVQGAGISLPVLLTPAALSPTFAQALAGAGGSPDSPLTTVGVPSPDTRAMSTSTDGAAASAYLAAVRTAADSPKLEDFFDAQPFRTVAADADAASHDAVIALVTAAARAKSTDPAAVLGALRSLSLSQADGLAGPALDLTHQQALGDASVMPVQSTTQGTDLRPATNQAQLFWFAVPDS